MNVPVSNGMYRPLSGVGLPDAAETIYLSYDGVHYEVLLVIPCKDMHLYPRDETGVIGFEIQNAEVQPILDRALQVASAASNPLLSQHVDGGSTGE